jgi:transglutaminase-like putative cysteine protease
VTQVLSGWAIDGSRNAGGTLKKMRQLVIDGSRTEQVIQAARAIVRYAGPRDYYGQAQALRRWLSEHLRFSRDPKGTELLQKPAFMLDEIRKHAVVDGDCDDAATLSAALATALGFACTITAVAFYSKHAPFQHVYTLVSVGRKPDGSPDWMDMDTTRPTRNLPPVVSRRITVKV